MSECNGQKPFYKRQTFWIAVSAISSAVASITAMITVTAIVSSWEEDRQLKRPYFSVFEQSIMETESGYRLSLKLKNIGVHSAENTSLKACWVSQDISETASCVENELAFAIPGQSKPKPESIKIYMPGAIRFIAIGIKYEHSILDTSYKQTFFLKLVAKTERKSSFLLHVSNKEKARVISHFDELLSEFN